jgi:hypothetical protein
MAGFENTSLWQTSLAKQLPADELEKDREFFRVNFESFRVNAGLLAAEISRDLPDYTVHDLTHLDALWEMASIICGNDYTLNPAEAFVLGGAFLIHDLGMGLAAYPDGINVLKKTVIWEDTISYLAKQKPGCEEVSIEKEAIAIVLRSLHAKHAEKLALISWGENDDLYLINDHELREAYGSIIGLIAHSHWWSSHELVKRLPSSLGAFEKMPNEWGVDPIKLACIMRVSDAAHIDARRAPLLLKAFRQPNEYAQQHWLFQQRLYQPRLESERLVYTSKLSFSPGEFNSWWLCFDTLRMVDKELRDVDSILGDSKRPRFKAKGVAAINNIGLLSKLIGTNSWIPVDTKVHVGNVARLVKNLGGEQLYGKNLIVPLRELIQNSCDAVRARRILENEDSDWGKVTVRTGVDESGCYLEVEDNGVGMSENVLSGPFLDFGTSFWGTKLMHDEFPGLESKGFSSTGKYGIGFFSAFMWGEDVSVTTRRFEDSRQSTKVLVFEKGLSNRPLLREAQENEYIRDGGTRIRVYFANAVTYGNLFEENLDDPLDICQLVEDLCSCLDVNITTEDLRTGKTEIAIRANDWKSLESNMFLKRTLGNRYFQELSDENFEYLVQLSKNIRNVVKDGEVVGRGFMLNTGRFSHGFDEVPVEGVVTVGGFRTIGLTKLVGLFVGDAVRASRDIGVPIASGKELIDWASEQSELLIDKTDAKEQLECSSYIRALGGSTNKLAVAEHKVGIICLTRFEELVRGKLKEIVIVGDSSFSNLKRKHGEIVLNENVFIADPGRPGILQTRVENYLVSWPKIDSEYFGNHTLQGLLEERFSRIWEVPLDSVLEASDISSDEKKYECIIGKANGEDIEMDFVDIIRLAPSSV